MSRSEFKASGANVDELAAKSVADAEYDAWAKAKIEDALREAEAHPERKVSQDRIWKKFGLER